MPISIASAQNNLSNLLPYDPSDRKQKEITVCLKEYRLLTAALEEAIEAFEKKEFEKFDALVGENACQIRAIKITSIASKHLNVDSDQILKVRNKIDGLLLANKSKPNYNANSLKDLLEKENLDISLTSDEMFLIQAYILAEMKKVEAEGNICRKEVADPKKIKRLGNDVATHFTNKLARKLRQLLSAASVEFVRETAKSLGDRNLIKMSSEEFTYKHNECWPCVPMFWTYQTLLKRALKENIPILMHVKFLASDQEYKTINEEKILFQAVLDNEGHRYVEMDPSCESMNDVVCVVQGVVCGNNSELPTTAEWKTRMATYSITDVIYAGAADHRQYPDAAQDRILDGLMDNEYDSYKALAKNAGCSLDNPSLFFIQHVYASQLKNAI